MHYAASAITLCVASIMATVPEGMSINPDCYKMYTNYTSRKGGQATVYRGNSREDGTAVALKVFKNDDEYRAEYSILLDLNNNYAKENEETWFPKLYGVCQCGAMFAIAMELVPYKFPKSKSSDALSKPLYIMHQLLCYVARLHDAGYSHNDLKEDNIRMTSLSDDRIKLIDFGLATDISTPPILGHVGSLGHIPPEMIRYITENEHRDEIDKWIAAKKAPSLAPIATEKLDSWALGILGFELLTGTAAYDDKQLTELHVCMQNSEKYATYEGSTVCRHYAQYFYFRELLSMRTASSELEELMIKDCPHIIHCNKRYHIQGTVENRFKQQVMLRILEEVEYHEREYNAGMNELWQLVGGLLQFDNNARMDVHEALQSPAFQRFSDLIEEHEVKCGHIQ